MNANSPQSNFPKTILTNHGNKRMKQMITSFKHASLRRSRDLWYDTIFLFLEFYLITITPATILKSPLQSVTETELNTHQKQFK